MRTALLWRWATSRGGWEGLWWGAALPHGLWKIYGLIISRLLRFAVSRLPGSVSLQWGGGVKSSGGDSTKPYVAPTCRPTIRTLTFTLMSCRKKMSATIQFDTFKRSCDHTSEMHAGKKPTEATSRLCVNVTDGVKKGAYGECQRRSASQTDGGLSRHLELGIDNRRLPAAAAATSAPSSSCRYGATCLRRPTQTKQGWRRKGADSQCHQITWAWKMNFIKRLQKRIKGGINDVIYFTHKSFSFHHTDLLLHIVKHPLGKWRKSITFKPRLKQCQCIKTYRKRCS